MRIGFKSGRLCQRLAAQATVAVSPDLQDQSTSIGALIIYKDDKEHPKYLGIC